MYRQGISALLGPWLQGPGWGWRVRQAFHPKAQKRPGRCLHGEGVKGIVRKETSVEMLGWRGGGGRRGTKGAQRGEKMDCGEGDQPRDPEFTPPPHKGRATPVLPPLQMNQR